MEYKTPHMISILTLVGALIALLAIAGTANAQAPLKVGDVRPYNAESPHPYPAGNANRPVVWTDSVVSHGAEFLRIRFRGFALAEGDYVTVSNPNGSNYWTYTGRGPKGTGDFWSFSVKGDTAIVKVHAGPRNANGYRIDAIGHGTGRGGPTSAEPEVVCGTDGREDIACRSSEVGAHEQAVAQLLFVSGAFQYTCTGWLVDGSQSNTLITNNHCISKQSEVDTLQATFNYQATSCNSSTTAATDAFAGGALLITNNVDRRGSKGGLDYTLLTLDGNPEATWQELTPTTTPVSVGDLIWFIQHPGGRLKEIGYYEDAAESSRCDIHTVNETYGRSAQGSQIGYECDSEGGSSGSPILLDDSSDNGYVIALHHFGNVENTCLNSGTSMVDICADAGALLNCNSGGTPPPEPPPPQQCGLNAVGESCNSNSDCCSNKCKGKPGSMTCK